MKNENEKRGEAAAKQDPQGNGAKYTPLGYEAVRAVIEDAADGGFADDALAERVREEAEVEEVEECPGTWNISFYAKTWREDVAFTAAVIGAAFARGLFAEEAAWPREREDDLDKGLVGVFVTAADYVTDDGTPVVRARR